MQFLPTLKIGNRRIGPGHPCFIIAEAGVNHNGSLDNAIKLVDEAKNAGADAVKFQTFHTEELVSVNAPKADYQIKNTGSSESQFQMLKKLELSFENHEILKSYCEKKNILFLSSAFGVEDINLLVKLNVPAIKIPSGELANVHLLRKVGNIGLPVILSTGMSTLGEVEMAFHELEESGSKEIVILHCVSAYPTPFDAVHLSAMKTLSDRFQVPVGFSDHTLGTDVSIAAVALGARMIEKHFTLNCSFPGPDHLLSLEPKDFKGLVNSIRNVEKSLGQGIKRLQDCEKEVKRATRKSLVANCFIRKGDKILSSMVSLKRPGTGLGPEKLEEVIGKVANQTIEKDTLLESEMFS